MKLAVVAAFAAALVTLLLPATSQASPHIQFGVQDDAYLSAGPTLQGRLDTLDRLGAKLVRYTVDWRAIATRKPKRAVPVLLKEVRRDFGPKRIWLTEYGYQTNPPERFGVSRSVQAKYVAEAALRAKSARFVDVLIHFIIRDEPRLSGWQSGLFSAAGVVKPSFNSFMLPIVQSGRVGLLTTIWGQVRPGKGRRWYRLQRLARRRWVSIGRPARTSVFGSYARVIRVQKARVCACSTSRAVPRRPR